MSEKKYIHGYSNNEQDRLLDQAMYWKDRLILKYSNYRSHESLLEIGCGRGAVIEIMAQAFPSLKISGIDLSAEQIETGKAHLSELGIEADLRIGDANQLPWQDHTFDHIYCSWVLEHMIAQKGVLSEAFRVLKPGGQIRIHETDYSTWACSPNAESFEMIRKAWYKYFEQAGKPSIGRELGALLNQAGFKEINNEGKVMNYHKNDRETELQQFVEYIINFTRPVAKELSAILEVPEEEFVESIDNFEKIYSDPFGCISVTVHKATATK